MSKRTFYKFIAAVGTQTLEEILVKFLKNKDLQITEKDKIFWAVSAYWLPLAMKESQCCSQEQLKHFARTAIYKLQQHINYLAQTFGLEEVEFLAWSAQTQIRQQKGVTPSPQERSNQTQLTASKALPNSLDENSIDSSQRENENSLSQELAPEKFLHHGDDDSFQKMFS